VGEGAGLGLGEVELEGQHGGSLLSIKYVINSKKRCRSQAVRLIC